MRYRYLDLLIAAFCCALVLSNVLANKLVTVAGLTVNGGTLLFPLTYWAGDVFTEVYGYSTGRRAIWLAFGCQIVAVLCIALTVALPAVIPPAGVQFNAALALSGWIVAGSLLAFWCGQFVNDAIVAVLKVATRRRWLWSRTLSSTIIGQAVDTVVFVGVAFGIGARLPLALLWQIGWSVYVLKVAWEVLATPLTYASVARLKRAEGVDAYDAGTNLNPLAVSA